MLPHHKDWAVKRSMRRADKFSRDLARGKLRGQTRDQIEFRMKWNKEFWSLMQWLGRFDARIVSLAPEDGGGHYATFEFRCLECGSGNIATPADGDEDAQCACRACGNAFGPWGPVKVALEELVKDEVSYGEPHKFMEPGSGVGV